MYTMIKSGHWVQIIKLGSKSQIYINFQFLTNSQFLLKSAVLPNKLTNLV